MNSTLFLAGISFLTGFQTGQLLSQDRYFQIEIVPRILVNVKYSYTDVGIFGNSQRLYTNTSHLEEFWEYQFEDETSALSWIRGRGLSVPKG